MKRRPNRRQVAAVQKANTASDLADRIADELGAQSISRLYDLLVLSVRSRQYQLDAERRPGRTEIMHTLLGVELKIGRRRLLCPDLATARYLDVFARLGIDLIAVPYDVSQISRIADEFERAWHRTLLLVEHFARGRSDRLRNKVQKLLLDQTRAEIKQLGAGTKIPVFNQNTKQRRPIRP